MLEAAPVVGLTPERWDTLLLVCACLLFAAGVLIAEKL